MTALDDLPEVNSFFGLDLKTGSMIVAAIGVVHPMAYGCSFFLPMSYLLVTIWILVALFFAASIVLFCGVANVGALATSIEKRSYSTDTTYFTVQCRTMPPYLLTIFLYFLSFFMDDALLCSIWIWYTVIFVVVMLMMMILLALVFTSRKQRNRVFAVILGMLWYILTIYFILVVNSHRKALISAIANHKIELKAMRKANAMFKIKI